MRKIILFILLVLPFSFLNAQGISYGLKAGLNLSNFNSDYPMFNSDNLSSRFSFHAGAVVEFPVSDKFSVQPEVLYSSLGAVLDASSIVLRASDTDITYKGDYISIPVLAKYYVVDGLSLEIGPQIGFLLSAKYEYDGTDYDFKDNVKSTDFGVGFGSGYKLENGLFFNARYVLGLSNIAEDIPDDYSVKNNVFQFSVGYMIK